VKPRRSALAGQPSRARQAFVLRDLGTHRPPGITAVWATIPEG
jgi:hypothetical protein